MQLNKPGQQAGHPCLPGSLAVRLDGKPAQLAAAGPVLTPPPQLTPLAFKPAGSPSPEAQPNVRYSFCFLLLEYKCYMCIFLLLFPQVRLEKVYVYFFMVKILCKSKRVVCLCIKKIFFYYTTRRWWACMTAGDLQTHDGVGSMHGSSNANNASVPHAAK